MEQNDAKKILGYGEVLQLLTGRWDSDDANHKKGDPKIEKFHITPVSIKNTDDLISEINDFFGNVESVMDFQNKSAMSNGENIKHQKAYTAGINIIFLSTRKMHPELTKDEIKDKFNILAIAKCVQISLELNNFLTVIGEMMKMAKETETMQTKETIIKKS